MFRKGTKNRTADAVNFGLMDADQTTLHDGMKYDPSSSTHRRAQTPGTPRIGSSTIGTERDYQTTIEGEGISADHIPSRKYDHTMSDRDQFSTAEATSTTQGRGDLKASAKAQQEYEDLMVEDEGITPEQRGKYKIILNKFTDGMKSPLHELLRAAGLDQTGMDTAKAHIKTRLSSAFGTGVLSYIASQADPTNIISGPARAIMDFLKREIEEYKEGKQNLIMVAKLDSIQQGLEAINKRINSIERAVTPPTSPNPNIVDILERGAMGGDRGGGKKRRRTKRTKKRRRTKKRKRTKKIN